MRHGLAIESHGNRRSLYPRGRLCRPRHGGPRRVSRTPTSQYLRILPSREFGLARSNPANPSRVDRTGAGPTLKIINAMGSNDETNLGPPCSCAVGESWEQSHGHAWCLRALLRPTSRRSDIPDGADGFSQGERATQAFQIIRTRLLSCILPAFLVARASNKDVGTHLHTAASGEVGERHSWQTIPCDRVVVVYSRGRAEPRLVRG